VELQEWLSHPVGEAFQEFLRKWKESLQDQWAAGAFQGESSEVTMAANASALGQIRMIETLLGLEYDHFVEVLEDEDGNEGESSPGPRRNG
jgi:hypothetical protein